MNYINLIEEYIEYISKKDFTLLNSFLSNEIITQIIDGVNTTEETKVTRKDFVDSIKNWLTKLDSFTQNIINSKVISQDSHQVKISINYINKYILSDEYLSVNGTFYYVIDVNSNKIIKMLNIIKEKSGDKELLERAYFK